MLDFMQVSYRRNSAKSVIEIYPKFLITSRSDLMTRGGDFYAIWDEEKGLWSTKEERALYLIDKEVDEWCKKNSSKFEDSNVKVLYMWDADTGLIDKWHKYVQKQLRDNYHLLDENVIFSNTHTTRGDYASKTLPYPLDDSNTPAFDELISKLYSETERAKIMWAIGSVFSGDSKKIQKFLVMYGAAGTGKSTILNIIQDLFEGYFCVFDAKALGSTNNAFALEAFKSNPLVAIQHDGDLSRIEDNTRLNSVVSHEIMTVNEKFKSTYANRFNCLLLMGTNKPVKITDAKSGLIRRLIDVTPTGEKFSASKYKSLTSQVKHELGGIANKCLEYYKAHKSDYDNYIPIEMVGASNDFYNFVADPTAYDTFLREDCTTLKAAWAIYNEYNEYAKVPHPYSQRIFKEELKNYFQVYKERHTLEDGTRVRSFYQGFIFDRFGQSKNKPKDDEASTFELSSTSSILDHMLADCPAQYATAKGTPLLKWSDVTTTLADISTERLHYVKVPENHIVIDFDLTDESGEKSRERNLEEASKWPKTYAEFSKSEKAVHLHYIYNGDVKKLSSVYSPGIEIKVFSGNSSLRRKLTYCNDAQVATISSGLPLKEENKMVNFEGLKNEKALRTFILRNLKKQYHAATKPSVDFIKTGLDKAYDSGMKYDISDMRPSIIAFAARSTHQSEYCLKLVNEMKFKSEEPRDIVDYPFDGFVFYDVEVFPNLFVIVYKSEDKDPIKMINPSPADVEALLRYKLVGFNNRRYDNHILYARLMGYSNEQLYHLSQRIVNGDKNAFFGEAYNLSYTDIYDFSSKKQSLKKFEIDLGIHHQELGFKWDEPVPEDKWDLVADYCINDVVATEATFKACAQDFKVRLMLSDISGLTPNDTTRMHTTKIIFGNEKHPKLVYTDLSEMFPGYTFDHGKSSYRGEDPGEGGYVYANPGAYRNIALLDIASMHPSSIIALNLFGDYTAKFKDILESRLAIKHRDFAALDTLVNGAFAPYVKNEGDADALAKALKLVINSVYGYTTANFDNPFKDIRNVDNIVAKRGALFMINLKHEVEAKGYKVAHIKTDSIKIPDADPDIVAFVQEYGKKYGYNFEFEAVYDRMCLVNDAVYIAKYMDYEKCKDIYGVSPKENVEACMKAAEKGWNGPWTATGTQFQRPVVFKTLFSGEAVNFKDRCETFQVSTALYLNMNEPVPDEDRYHFIGKVGQFCPMISGAGGGLLMREGSNGKFGYATGAKGYRWMESEMVKNAGLEESIDVSYYRKEVDEALAEIGKYCDPEEFRYS